MNIRLAAYCSSFVATGLAVLLAVIACGVLD